MVLQGPQHWNNTVWVNMRQQLQDNQLEKQQRQADIVAEVLEHLILEL